MTDCLDFLCFVCISSSHIQTYNIKGKRNVNKAVFVLHGVSFSSEITWRHRFHNIVSRDVCAKIHRVNISWDISGFRWENHAKRKDIKKELREISSQLSAVNQTKKCKLLATRRRNCRATEQRLQSFFRLRVNHKCKGNRAWIK